MRFSVQRRRPPAQILGLRRSVVRLVGAGRSPRSRSAPGFMPVLFDRRRRALQDWMARTVVTERSPRPARVRRHAPAPRRERRSHPFRGMPGAAGAPYGRCE